MHLKLCIGILKSDFPWSLQSLYLTENNFKYILVVNCCMLVAYLALTALLHIGRRSEQPALKTFHQILLTIVPRALWLLSILHFSAYVMLQPSFSPR